MLSEIFRFTLRKPQVISSPEFTDLRRAAAKAGAVRHYFGYTISTSFSPLPRKRHEVFWVVDKFSRDDDE
ncbi:hypothetical protein J3459_011342 [Metarhizium acridum]|nr:hypothetical protein J3459_011342 [Metarhizium acridum]